MGVIVTRHDAVVDIALDWPEVRNALGPEQGRTLRLALEEALACADTGAIVLSARGRAFCSGGNLPEILRLGRAGPDAVRNTVYGEFQGVFRAIREARVPVITAVDGPAIGFGCDLALAGHLTYMGSKAWLAQGWIHAGLIPATGGMLYQRQRGGPQAVWRLLAADRVDGPTAQEWGFAVACEDALDSALTIAARLAALPRAPMQAMCALARIEEPAEHLAAALEHQVGFITDPGFEASVQKLLKA